MRNNSLIKAKPLSTYEGREQELGRRRTDKGSQATKAELKVTLWAIEQNQWPYQPDSLSSSEIMRKWPETMEVGCGSQNCVGEDKMQPKNHEFRMGAVVGCLPQ